MYAYYWTPITKGHIVSSRRLITVLLDSECCKSCGCRGRCTRNAIWTVVAWSWAAFRRGVHPSTSPFHKPLRGMWATRANQPLRGKGQVARMGADWEAYTDLLGTRRWNHKTKPCPWCGTDLECMHDYSVDHPALTCQDSAQAKASTTISVNLDRGLAISIHVGLKADFRKYGSRGKALQAHIGARVTTHAMLPRNLVHCPAQPSL